MFNPTLGEFCSKCSHEGRKLTHTTHTYTHTNIYTYIPTPTQLAELDYGNIGPKSQVTRE